MSKIRGWVDRYFFPTMLSLVLSLSLALLLSFLFGNPFLTAFGGTWGDNLGFYGLIVYKDIRERRKKDERITLIGLLKVVRNMVAEFGPGEYLDSFIIRPAAMVFFPKILDNEPVGIFIAKFAADVTFFAPTIVAYEIRKRVFKD